MPDAALHYLLRSLAALALYSLVSVNLGCASTQGRVRSTMPQPPTADVTLHSESYGEGPPVLLIHGFGGSTYSWRYLIEPLAQSHRVIAIDLKGFGASPKPRDGAYSLHDQVALVHRFIIEHDLRDLTIMGHSLGGGVTLMTALKLIEEQPPRLKQLVLIGSAGMPQRNPPFIRQLRIPVIGFLGVHLLPSRFLTRKTLAMAYHRPERITEEQVAAYAAPLTSPGGRHALLATARCLPPPDIREIVAQYPRIDVPALLIWGRHDTIVPVDVGRRLNEALPQSGLVLLDDAGHMPTEEVPAETIAAITDFLKSP